MDTVMSVGDIVKEPTSMKSYRIISVSDEDTILCEMNKKNFILFVYNSRSLVRLLVEKKVLKEKEEVPVFDFDSLPEKAKTGYEKKKKVASEVLNAYEHNIMELYGKGSKPKLDEILNKYSVPKNTFWRFFTKYVQSGMKDYSLIDSRYLGINKGKKYKYNIKPGQKSEYFDSLGVIVTNEIKDYFDEALKEYRSGRQMKLKDCYDRMNAIHFTKTEIINGVPSYVLLPESERPTMRQFYYYASKQITEQEKDAIKTSIQEQRNNKRLITSDSMHDVFGPGDMVEIDACEVDVSLVSSFDPNKTIGRPIVYFMIDVFTRMILAVSVAFDNNSILGLTNLFLNLADDKQQYCKKFGISFDNPSLWQSNIIPRRVRVDRGPEFKSKEFDRICNELGIEKQIVPGASGSLKGIVEQSFHKMHSKQNPHLENYGLIEKRYDSNHHKEATLNIEQYTKMVINFVLTHNQEYDNYYRVTNEMLEKGVKPIPCLLWEYGVQKYGRPRPIPVHSQYLFNLMTPVKAKLDRRGISYKHLYYLSDNDIKLSKEMFMAGTKKAPFEARMDMRDVSHIYYLRDGKLIKASLNERLSGNADYKGLTMKQYEERLKRRKQMEAEGKIYNQEIAMYNYSVNAAIVDEAKKTSLSDYKNMRAARELEKQTVSHEDNIATRIESAPELIEKEERESIEKLPDIKDDKDYKNFEEALEDFYENN